MLLGVFGIFGSFCGGLLANVVPSDILRFIFGILLFIVAVDMLVGFKREGNGTRVPFTKFTAMAFGISIGLISGLLGVGGGVFAVPLLSILFGFTLREAIGTSSIFIAITAIGWIHIEGSYWNIFDFHCDYCHWRRDFIYHIRLRS